MKRAKRLPTEGAHERKKSRGRAAIIAGKGIAHTLTLTEGRLAVWMCTMSRVR